MAEFYQSFLRWVIDDPSVGLIIKSKKPGVINGLQAVGPLLGESLQTGRCLRVEDEWGRLPSEAAWGADMAVGIGISSALIEAVIAGCRGVHYDSTRFKKHEFYQWGDGDIIFDDLETMMVALKRYKESPKSLPKLGDWAPYLNLLDSFGDGKGSQRMGSYMHWLLEGFEVRKDRNQAIQFANQQYAQLWGEDKIVTLREGKINPLAEIPRFKPGDEWRLARGGSCEEKRNTLSRDYKFKKGAPD